MHKAMQARNTNSRACKFCYFLQPIAKIYVTYSYTLLVSLFETDFRKSHTTRILVMRLSSKGISIQ